MHQKFDLGPGLLSSSSFLASPKLTQKVLLLCGNGSALVILDLEFAKKGIQSCNYPF